MRVINPFKLLSWSCLLVLAVSLQTCATNPVTGKKQVSFISEAQEIQMGQEYDPQIVAQMGEYKDPELEQFLTRKGLEMARGSHRPELPWTFRLIDDPVVNAFAVPGGYVYFTRGIMAHFNNEAQFAGVLGHEIGHVTARHSVQQQSKQTLLSGLAIGGMILSPTLASQGESLMQGMQLLFLKYGRDDESQSDELGVEYSTMVGYDAKEMAGFFTTLDRLTGGAENRTPTFLSTHPDPANREQKVRQMATATQQKLRSQGKTTFDVGRNSYLRMLEGLMYGADPRQGFVEQNQFFHPELKFQYRLPNGWQTQNSPSMVQTVEPNGNAAIRLQLGQGSNTQAAAQSFASENQLQVINSGQQTINGNTATLMIAQTAATDANGQQQEVIKIKAGFISYSGNVYMLMGLTSQQNFSRYESSFDATISSFNKLTDPDKLNRQAERIRIATVSGNKSLQSALQAEGIPSNRVSEFSILNGMQPNQTVQSGTLIKVLQR